MLPPVLFFIYCMSHLVQGKHSSECTVEVFFFFKESFQTKLKNKMFACFTSSCEKFHHTSGLWAHKKLLVALPRGSSKGTLAVPSLQTLNTHLLEQSTAEQANQPRSDSCVNKACCAVWKLCHLHKVCLREEHKGRTRVEGWGKGGGVEVD